MGTVRFENDHFEAITGYRDYVQGNLTICHVYYVEGLGHNLFLVRQFCDGDLEVAFRSNTCYVWNLEGDDLLTVDGLPKFKLNKDHLCSTCEQGKRKKASLPPKLVPSTESKLELIHMDLCGPMRVASIDGKKYILVIDDDYSWYTWNQCIVHTRYNKTPYELIRGRKPNIQYFHVFGSLCYPINDHDDLGKMKPKANIDIFIGYSESSRGFCIYNRRTKKIMETIHVKFEELTAMVSECNNSEPGFNCTNFQDSSKDSQSVPSKTDLDNLFGPLYEEYYATSPSEVSDFAANTLENDDTSSSSLIVVEEDEAPKIVSSSVEQVSSEPNTPVLNDNADELVQEDVAELDGNVFYNPPQTLMFEEAESSSTYHDSSNMHEFHQTHRTKNHPIKQVIGDPSIPVTIRRQLHTNAKVCMYALTVSTTEPKNIKEAMLDASWIESMQDELNHFKRLDVRELVECPIGKT
ncbi:retrovirus-related pol polyprotein from transposon TNT 1-94 [Tanacetum coccineum]